MVPPVWQTSKGSIGVYPSNELMTKVFVATPVLPAVSVSYQLLGGELPIGLNLSEDGILKGIPAIIGITTVFTFVIRATDNFEQIADRTFTITISGIASPQFITPPGNPSNVIDSVWYEYQIPYTNPVADNPVSIRVIQGFLPPGLEINEYGLIRGYPKPPVILTNYEEINTFSTETKSSDNSIVVESTINIRKGRPVQFSGTALGGIDTLQTYYVREILNDSEFTISQTQNGPIFTLTDGTGFMFIKLSKTVIEEPTVRQYTFNLQLSSPLGSDIESFSIIVKNHYLPQSEGGPTPSNPPASRLPVILNTRPLTFDIENDQYYDYYSLPITGNGVTYPLTVQVPIGTYLSDNYFSFKVIGKDFDDNEIYYNYSTLPLGLIGDPVTGWVTGTPIIPFGIDEFVFTVKAIKVYSDLYSSPNITFKFKISNKVSGDIVWVTDENLGNVFAGSISLLKVEAVSDTPIKYRLVTGSQLPPNLTMLSNGEITGKISWQPDEVFQPPQTSKTFSFIIEAYSELYDIVTSTREFTVTVIQEFVTPTDNIYIKCTPSIQDRYLIESLLVDDEIIPEEFLYRPEDSNFGKASNVTYQHAFGIHASSLPQYIAAIQKNHFWRNITLGPIKTAQARDENTNELLYEVVYSEVIDDLINNEGESVSEEIIWPRNINLNEGPWYTSITDIYTSYIFATPQELITNKSLRPILTQAGISLLTQQGVPTFYTSLSPGSVRTLYPNSLVNMRDREEQELGQDYSYKLLPKWMTSQQSNGGTLGFTPAWVIAYTKPGKTYETVATRTAAITNLITVPSTFGFEVNRPVKFFGATIGGILPNVTYYIKEIFNDISFSISESINGNVVELNEALGVMDVTIYAVSYAEIIKENIENKWLNISGNVNKLNKINFKLDRITIDKSQTFDYDSELSPPSWINYPGGTPQPVPSDSKDFYVLFPRKTILPNRTQQ